MTSSGSTNEQATSSACEAEGRVQRAGRASQGLEGTVEVYQAENRKKCVPDTKKAILKKKKESPFSFFHCLLGTKTLFYTSRQQYRDTEPRELPIPVLS